MCRFLRTDKTKIVTPRGRFVILKGVNLGGWLMMEGYILHAPNIAEQIFKKNFGKTLGKNALRHFKEEFRNNFIREEDFRRIAGFGFNCVRLPFNCRLIEKGPYRYDKSGLRYLDKAVRWAKKYSLWVILDLHAAAGAQNHDWHSDSLGQANLWFNKRYQDRTFALWELLADRYKEEEALAGYDLLNESVIHDTKTLNIFYKKLIHRIRNADKNHILFVEGNNWATDIECLDEFDDDNYALSIHAYQPIDFTAHLIPGLSYPAKHRGATWNKNILKKILWNYKKIAERRSVPVFAGEFGVNYRFGLFGEDRWLSDILDCFKEFNFHWTYWTYKAVKNSIFPDGILSYYDNPDWVHRQGPRTGWDTYHLHWKDKRKEIIRSWQTENFSENRPIVNILKNVAR